MTELGLDTTNDQIRPIKQHRFLLGRLGEISAECDVTASKIPGVVAIAHVGSDALAEMMEVMQY